jgi:Flp pilus assembly protein TadD
MIAYASVDGGINREQEIAAAKQRIEALNLKSQIPKVPRENRKKVRDYNQKGLEFVVKGQIAEAVQAFRAAYQEDRGDVEILNNLGDTLARNGEWDAAEQYLFSTLLFAPGRAIAWANLGYTYAKQSKTTSAVACFANAYRFSRNRETTYQLFQKLMAEDDDAKVRDVALQVLQLELVRAGRSEVTNR